MITIPIATKLSDGDLVSAVARLVAEGRHRTADLVALLVALETRTVHVEAGYASLFRFCVGRLGLSEEEAFYRIAASRVAARFPVVLERLREGRLTLTAVALLRKHLTEANHLQVLAAAEGRTKREIQILVARLAPRPDVPVSIRKLPPPRMLGPSVETAFGSPASAGRILEAALEREPAADPQPAACEDRAWAAAAVSPAAVEFRPDNAGGGPGPSVALRAPAVPPADAVMTPLAPGRYSLRLTISEETHTKLRRAQDLLAHAVAPGDTAAVLDRALTLLVAQLEQRKYAALHPRARRPPGAHRRVVESAAPPTTDAVAVVQEPAAESRSAAPTATASRPATGATLEKNQRQYPPRSIPAASEKRRRARPARYIPAAVRREVWQREGGRCGYVAPDGNRCAQTSQLEFHHTLPVVDGGVATASGLTLRCTAHHALETRRWFGEEVSAYRGRRAFAACPESAGTRAGPSKVTPGFRQPESLA